MDLQIQIRPFVAKDMGAVVDLLQELSSFYPDRGKMSILAEEFLKKEEQYCCVATSNEKVVGFGSVFFVQRIRGGYTAFFEDIVVDDQLRGKGIGRKIVLTLIEEAIKKKCFKGVLESSKLAENFYRSLGFCEDGKLLKIKLI